MQNKPVFSARFEVGFFETYFKHKFHLNKQDKIECKFDNDSILLFVNCNDEDKEVLSNDKRKF